MPPRLQSERVTGRNEVRHLDGVAAQVDADDALRAGEHREILLHVRHPAGLRCARVRRYFFSHFSPVTAARAVKKPKSRRGILGEEISRDVMCCNSPIFST